ncbi:MAG: tetratricopeptide repeat protein [Cyanobacteria bacterium J06639_14]
MVEGETCEAAPRMDFPAQPKEAFESLLKRYEQAIASLKHSNPDPQSFLAALLVRDAIQMALAENSPTAPDFLQLDQLDVQLKTYEPQISELKDLERWRKLQNPIASAWWWFPQIEVPKRFRWFQQDWLWNGLSIGFLAIASSLILNTASRFWGGGIASAGTLAVVAQSVLTLIAGKGALTASGREAWEQFLQRRNIPEHYWQEWSCAASGGVFLVVAGIHGAMPWFATWYNDWGLQAYEADRLASALHNYQVAINLRPDYAEAYYHLGVLYEDLQQEADAIEAYQFVVERGPDTVDLLTWLRANNNLGRLYILQDNDRAAVTLLIQGTHAVEEDAAATDVALAKIRYSLLKNLGWVRSEQDRYAEAEAVLEQAISSLEDERLAEAGVRNRGSAYCLMAQVLDAQQYADEADAFWETCLIEANVGNPDEDTWIGVYEQRSQAENTEAMTP